MFTLAGKRVLVTGACGTVGSELIRQLRSAVADRPELVVGIDNNESELFFLQDRFSADKDARFFLADVRDRADLAKRLRGIHVVFHTAALKHVILCEDAPDQAILTNIQGVQNVIAEAAAARCERLVLTSSDKAVNPTSVMGTSKLIGEKLVTAAAAGYRDSGIVFTSTRFGNVLGSNGSVVQIFRRQIAAGGPVTLTDERMTRFVMGVDEAVRLVIDSATLAVGGEVFITKMRVIRILDLAAAMIEEADRAGSIEIKVIGVKPGEKLYEELMNTEETRRALELDNYFVVQPPFEERAPGSSPYGRVVNRTVDRAYISTGEMCLTVPEIRALLREKHLV